MHETIKLGWEASGKIDIIWRKTRREIKEKTEENSSNLEIADEVENERDKEQIEQMFSFSERDIDGVKSLKFYTLFCILELFTSNIYSLMISLMLCDWFIEVLVNNFEQLVYLLPLFFYDFHRKLSRIQLNNLVLVAM